MLEVYSSFKNLERSHFFVGNSIISQTFTSAVTLWPIAVDALQSNFQKEGTVFIIKSKTGRLVSNHAKFSFDNEVIFQPGVKFIVSNWYIGDVIALGQANIREHTFGITPDQYQMWAKSVKPLIIELIESSD